MWTVVALRLVYVIILPLDEKIVKFGKSIVKAEKKQLCLFFGLYHQALRLCKP